MTWEPNNGISESVCLIDVGSSVTPGNGTHYGEYTKTSTKIRTLDPVLIPFQSKL